jgi:hypothetical protein
MMMTGLFNLHHPYRSTPDIDYIKVEWHGQPIPKSNEARWISAYFNKLLPDTYLKDLLRDIQPGSLVPIAREMAVVDPFHHTTWRIVISLRVTRLYSASGYKFEAVPLVRVTRQNFKDLPPQFNCSQKITRGRSLTMCPQKKCFVNTGIIEDLVKSQLVNQFPVESNEVRFILNSSGMHRPYDFTRTVHVTLRNMMNKGAGLLDLFPPVKGIDQFDLCIKPGNQQYIPLASNSIEAYWISAHFDMLLPPAYLKYPLYDIQPGRLVRFEEKMAIVDTCHQAIWLIEVYLQVTKTCMFQAVPLVKVTRWNMPPFSDTYCPYMPFSL